MVISKEEIQKSSSLVSYRENEVEMIKEYLKDHTPEDIVYSKTNHYIILGNKTLNGFSKEDVEKIYKNMV